MDLMRGFVSSSLTSTLGDAAEESETVATDQMELGAAEILAALAHSKKRDAVPVVAEFSSKWGCKRKRVSSSVSPPSDIGLNPVDPVRSGSDLAEIPFVVDPPKPSETGASIFYNEDYAIRMAQSVVPVHDRQYIMRNPVSQNLRDVVADSVRLMARLVSICDGHRHFRVGLMNDMKNDQTIKAKEAAQEARGVAESARMVAERSLFEAQAARDEAFGRAVYLESERNRLTVAAVVDIEARLGQMLSEKEALLVELAEWKERSARTERMLSTEVYNRTTVEQALQEAKRWQAGEDERVKFAVARAREEALQEAQMWRAGEKERINSAVARVKKEAVDKIVTYGLRFRHSALFLIRKKYHELDFSDIDFSTMEGHDIPDLNDGIDAEGGAEDADPGSAEDAADPESSPTRRWQAGEVDRVEFAVARARDEALQEAQRWRDGEEERINSAVARVKREEAVKKILTYGFWFRRSALFLIRKKYPDLNFSNIDFSSMEGHDIPDPDEGIDAEGGAEDADLGSTEDAADPESSPTIDDAVNTNFPAPIHQIKDVT